MTPYPADGNWWVAANYYLEAARLVLGESAVALAAAGVVAPFVSRRRQRPWWMAILLALPVVFYIWSLRSSSTPIFVPTMWPHSWYNTRYALAMLPLAAFGTAWIVSLIAQPYRNLGAIAVVFAVLLPFLLLRPSYEHWACWRESLENSQVRREWTRAISGYLRTQYVPGDGVFYSFGDLTGVLRSAGIPLRETLHEGNELEWYRTAARPELFLRDRWVLAFDETAASKAAAKLGYQRVMVFYRKGDTAVILYRKAPGPTK